MGPEKILNISLWRIIRLSTRPATCMCPHIRAHLESSPLGLEVGLNFRAGLHCGGEGLRSVKNAWPRHGYMRQMVDVPEKY